jgi:hypothetical protein
MHVAAALAGWSLLFAAVYAGQLGRICLAIGKSPQKRFPGEFRTLSYEIASRTLCPVASV